MVMKSSVAWRSEPWVPRVLRDVPAEVLERLTYAVLDDVDAGDAVVVTAPWPRLDALGRVRYALADRAEVTVPVDEWVSILDRRLPSSMRERPPRVGDAFAMLLSATPGDSLRPVGPVVDVTAEAREVARAAFYGAVAIPLDKDEAERMPRAASRSRLKPVAVPEEWLT